MSAACNDVDGASEIILVDDGSRDDSWPIVAGSESPHVRALRLSRNFGQQAALKAGFAEATGRYVIMMDADLEDDPAMIPVIHRELRGPVDICYTAYPDKNKRNARRTSRLFHRAVASIAKADHTPNIATMRGFSRKVLDAILRYRERRPVYGPLMVGMGFPSTTIEVEMPDRKGINSNYNLAKRVRLAMDYLVGYTNLPAVFFMVASGISFLATTAYSASIIIQYLIMGNQLPPGISLLMVVILLLFSMLFFFGIGIVGLYLHRLLDESLDRPLYLIAERKQSTACAPADIQSKGDLHVRRD